MTAVEMAEQIRELVSGQEILTQKVERLERALREIAGDPGEPYGGAFRARCVLDETFPI